MGDRSPTHPIPPLVPPPLDPGGAEQTQQIRSCSRGSEGLGVYVGQDTTHTATPTRTRHLPLAWRCRPRSNVRGAYVLMCRSLSKHEAMTRFTVHFGVKPTLPGKPTARLAHGALGPGPNALPAPRWPQVRVPLLGCAQSILDEGRKLPAEALLGTHGDPQGSRAGGVLRTGLPRTVGPPRQRGVGCVPGEQGLRAGVYPAEHL